MSIKSFIEELDEYTVKTDKHLFVESKANHAIVAAINVLQSIRENFDEKEADELTRRLINSIRGEDPRKFQRKIRQIRESKK